MPYTWLARLFRVFSIALLAIVTISCDSGSGPSPVQDSGVLQPEDYVLVWSDEFDEGSSPSVANWSLQSGYGDFLNPVVNNEWQLYTGLPENIRVENGNLVISALCVSGSCDGVNGSGIRDDTITSARINSKDKFEIKYGNIQARIKMPPGKGTWPAFWMLGAVFPDQPWPGAGEIDIVEMHQFFSNDRTTHFTIHWCDDDIAAPDDCEFSNGYINVPVPPDTESKTFDEALTDDYHVYEVDWDEERIVGKIDGLTYFIRSIDPDTQEEFLKSFYMILNIAVGGDLGGPPGPSITWPQQMLVDWVRVYKKPQADTLEMIPENPGTGPLPYVRFINSAEFGGDSVVAEPESKKVTPLVGEYVLELDFESANTFFSGGALALKLKDLTYYSRLVFSIDSSQFPGFDDISVEMNDNRFTGTGPGNVAIPLSDYTPTVSGNWRTYEIPLTDFAGVNLDNVVLLGFFNPFNSSGQLIAGKLYIDDIRLIREECTASGSVNLDSDTYPASANSAQITVTDACLANKNRNVVVLVDNGTDTIGVSVMLDASGQGSAVVDFGPTDDEFGTIAVAEGDVLALAYTDTRGVVHSDSAGIVTLPLGVYSETYTDPVLPYSGIINSDTVTDENSTAVAPLEGSVSLQSDFSVPSMGNENGFAFSFESILVNPGFEADDASGGDAAGATGWTTFESVFTNSAVGPAFGPVSHDAGGTQSLAMFGPFFFDGASGAYQADDSVTAGEAYTATAHVMNWSPDALAPDNLGIFQLSFWDAPGGADGGGNNIGTTEILVDSVDDGVNIYLPGQDGADISDWTELSITETAPAGTRSAQLFMLHVQLNDPAVGGKIFWDDVSLAPAVRDISAYRTLKFGINTTAAIGLMDLEVRMAGTAGVERSIFLSDYAAIPGDVAGWQVYEIPLSAFAGLDLTDVASLGFYNATSDTAGSGTYPTLLNTTLYFDDVHFTAADAQLLPLTGVLVNSAVEGVTFQTATQSGITNALGEFQYLQGEMVTFSVGGIVLGTVPGAAIITPVELTGSADPSDQTAVNLMVFLQSIDADQDPSNGITISAATQSAAAGQSLDFGLSSVDFTSAVTSVVAAITEPDNAVVSETTALDNFYQTYVALGGSGTFSWPYPGYPPYPAVASFPVDFEDAGGPYFFTDFDGGVATVIDNPDISGINTSAKVAQMQKFAGAASGGSTLTLGTVDFSAGDVFTMKVRASRAVPVTFRLEGLNNVERVANHSGSGAWENLVFDFTGDTGAGVSAISVIFDDGTIGDADNDAASWTFYIDDINLQATVPPAPGGTLGVYSETHTDPVLVYSEIVNSDTVTNEMSTAVTALEGSVSLQSDFSLPTSGNENGFVFNFGPAGGGGGTNLLSNGGFESPDASAGDIYCSTDWTCFNAGNFTNNTAGPAFGPVSHETPGTQSLKQFGVDGGAFQVVAATPGETYEASVWAMNWLGDPLNNLGILQLSFLDAGGNTIAGSVFENFVDPVDDGTNIYLPVQDGADISDWTRVTASGLAPAGTVSAKLLLLHVLTPPAPAGGTVRWDDASLSAAAAPVAGEDISAYATLKFGINKTAASGLMDLEIKMESNTGSASVFLSAYMPTTSGDWDVYEIPLSAFTGLDLTDVISLGFYNATSDTAGSGTYPTLLIGTLYFDDVHFASGDPPPVPALTGVLVNSAVEGVTFQTATQSGITNALGEFRYLPGEMVTFSVGGIVLGTVPGAAIITPVELTGSADPSDQTAVNLMVFLQSIDADEDPSNGITISAATQSAAAGQSLDFGLSSVDFTIAVTSVVAAITEPDNAVVSETTALDNFYQTYVALGGSDTFSWPYPGYPPYPAVASFPVDFEDAGGPYFFTDFDGGVATVIDNPDISGINTSAKVAQMQKFAGAASGGSTLTLGTVDFSAGDVFTMKVRASRAVPVTFRLEGLNNVERVANHSGSGAWENLAFDFTGDTGVGVSAITVIFDNGTIGDADNDAANWTFYFDDINLQATVPPPPSNTLGVYSETHTDPVLAYSEIINVLDLGGKDTVTDEASMAVTALEGSLVLSADFISTGAGGDFNGFVFNFGPAGGGGGTNLLSNGGFESPDASGGDIYCSTDWTCFNAGNFTNNTAGPAFGPVSHETPGTQSLKQFGVDGGAFQVVAATPGVTYEASVWAMNWLGDPLNNLGILQLSFLDAGGNTIAGSVFENFVDPVDDGTNIYLPVQDGADISDWTRVTASGLAPAGTVSAKLLLLHVLTPPAPAGGTVRWDDASLSAAAAPVAGEDISAYATLKFGINKTAASGLMDLEIKMESNTGSASVFLSAYVPLTSGDWDVYEIPLSAFTGLDLTDVISLGFYNATSDPAGSGTYPTLLDGTLYFDDIHFTTEPPSVTTAGVYTETHVDPVLTYSEIINLADFGGNETIPDELSTAVSPLDGTFVLQALFLNSSQPNGGIIFNFDTVRPAVDGVDISAFTTLKFGIDISGVPSFEDLVVQLEDGVTMPNVFLSAYTSTDIGNWKVYEIPLDDFTGLDTANLVYLGFWNASGQAGAETPLVFGPLYFDDIHFTK